MRRKKFCIAISQQKQTSSRRLQDVLKRSRRLTTKHDVVKTSGKRRRICDLLNTSDLHRLTTSLRRLIYVVLKTSNLRCLGNVWFTTCSGRLIYDVWKTSDLRRLEDVQYTTSWRRLIYDVLRTSVNGVCVATSQRRLYNVKRNCFFLFCTLWIIQKILRSSLG